jgi:hypothetical protein
MLREGMDRIKGPLRISRTRRHRHRQKRQPQETEMALTKIECVVRHGTVD